jgi:hypothetical protein
LKGKRAPLSNREEREHGRAGVERRFQIKSKKIVAGEGSLVIVVVEGSQGAPLVFKRSRCGIKKGKKADGWDGSITKTEKLNGMESGFGASFS